jgi:hypothetical protein
LAELAPELIQFAHSLYGSLGPGALTASRTSRNGQAEPQPQSPERSSVLELA